MAKPQHYQSCTDMAIGRRVAEFAAAYGPASFWSLTTLTAELDEHRGACSCFAVQLAKVEDDLRRQRKAFKAQPWVTNREIVIEQLKAQRDALRSVQS